MKIINKKNENIKTDIIPPYATDNDSVKSNISSHQSSNIFSSRVICGRFPDAHDVIVKSKYISTTKMHLMTTTTP